MFDAWIYHLHANNRTIAKFNSGTFSDVQKDIHFRNAKEPINFIFDASLIIKLRSFS